MAGEIPLICRLTCDTFKILNFTHNFTKTQIKSYGSSYDLYKLSMTEPSLELSFPDYHTVTISNYKWWHGMSRNGYAKNRARAWGE